MVRFFCRRWGSLSSSCPFIGEEGSKDDPFVGHSFFQCSVMCLLPLLMFLTYSLGSFILLRRKRGGVWGPTPLGRTMSKGEGTIRVPCVASTEVIDFILTVKGATEVLVGSKVWNGW